jgi:hypothetical protein
MQQLTQLGRTEVVAVTGGRDGLHAGQPTDLCPDDLMTQRSDDLSLGLWLGLHSF